MAVGAWAAVVLFTTTQAVVVYTASGNPPNWLITLKFTALQWLPWLILAPVVVAIARRWPIRPPHVVLKVARHLGAAAAVAALVVALYFLARSLGGAPIGRTYVAELLRSVHSSVVVYAIITGLTHAAESMRRTRAREHQLARLETQLADARLQVLQTQLHPHFLFNTLHGISSLVHEDPDGAEDMLTALSDLLRLTLGRGDRTEVPLHEEIGLLERYVEIHRARLGARLRVTFEVSPEAADLMVPSFILQPLVENAIRHAIASRRVGGHLEIHAEVDGSRLRVRVLDDGPGLDAGATPPQREGLGLRNTRARLEQRYGEAHRFTVADRAVGGVEACIEVPALRQRVAIP
jgi:hypothetical protein